MNSWRRKYLYTGALTVLLVLSAYKYFNDYVVTASEAVSTVLREAANENKVYQISEEHMKVIKDLYESTRKYNLPHIEITKFISIRNDDTLERVIYKMDEKDDRWVMVPKKLGDNDAIYVEKNCRGHYLLQDIKLESKANNAKKDAYTVVTRINYSEYDNGQKRNNYLGRAVFSLKRVSINQWKVEGVEINPFANENNG